MRVCRRRWWRSLQTAQSKYVLPLGSTTQYPLSQCRGISEGWDQAFCILHPDVYGQRQDLAAAWDSTTVGNIDIGFTSTTTPHYAWNDPIFQKLNVSSIGSPRPAEPGGSGACSYNGGTYDAPVTVDVDSPACNQWRSDGAAWDASLAQATNNLQAAITPYNASVDTDNATLSFQDYTVINASSLTQRSQVTASQPGQILSGGSMTLTGTAITNTDSRIVAGGLLYVNGQSSATGSTPIAAAINNVATQGTQTTTYAGTSTFSHLDTCHHTFSTYHCRNTDGSQPYDACPVDHDLRSANGRLPTERLADPGW